MSSFHYVKENLPCFRVKTEIVKQVHSHFNVIFVGETGSGKTTQIPQYLYMTGLAKDKRIAVTQPRRVAAISIANRVATEMGTKVGEKVGYSVRFENVTSNETRIKYLTDGMLLRESVHCPLFLEYSVVILDEAHERTLCTDLLLGLLKKAQSTRQKWKMCPLKVIVMSATLDSEKMASFLRNAPCFKIWGRNYRVEVYYLDEPQENYVQSALYTVFDIHQHQEPGDVLVFCTGQEEIEHMVVETKLIALHLPRDHLKIEPLPLYAALPYEQQEEIFNDVPADTRKVIFATNIAETSITIPNIKYVIDTGKVKAKHFNPVSGFDTLRVQNISKDQSDQRSGRCGRDSPGKCYRLYTKAEFGKFLEHSVPEIQRCSLSSAILQIIAIGACDVYEFNFLDRPSDENIDFAVRTLKELLAVEETNDNKLQLSVTGKQMIKFPLDPRFSRMIIMSKEYNCTKDIISIISLLSVENIFSVPDAERDKFAEVRKKFESGDGDHITLLNVFKTYKKCKKDKSWAAENFINIRNMNKAEAIRIQLTELCESADITVCSSNSIEPIQIKKCLITGLFMNVALLHENEHFKMIEGKDKIKIHPSSTLFKRKEKPECVIFTELVQTKEIYMRNVTKVPEELLVSVMPKYFKSKNCRLATLDVPSNYAFC